MTCPHCLNSGWKPSGTWQPLINDAIPCECGALQEKNVTEYLEPKPKELVDVKPKEYLGKDFTETFINLNKLYRRIQNSGKKVRLVLDTSVLTPGCDPLQMYSYNTGSRDAINRAEEVVINHDDKMHVVKKRYVD